MSTDDTGKIETQQMVDMPRRLLCVCDIPLILLKLSGCLTG